MILIIPLSNNGSYDDLRFALRSITTHHDVTECILVGGKPDWYTGTHIAHKDYSPVFKEANIRDKVLVGASTVEGEFMFANDDHILLQPLDATYNKGLLTECLKTRIGNGSYTRLLRNTLEHYGDVLNVDCHVPMMMDATLVHKTNFQWPDFGIGFKTCYAQENGIESEYYPDCKTDKMPPPGRKWFSLAAGFPVRELFGMFNKPSIFEK